MPLFSFTHDCSFGELAKMIVQMSWRRRLARAAGQCCASAMHLACANDNQVT